MASVIGRNSLTCAKSHALHIIRGEDKIGSYHKTPHSHRQWCKICGGHLFTQHPGLGLVDVYAAVIPDLPFQPGLHVHYQETRLPLEDGLPKLRDLPKEMGGSGELMAP